MIATNVQKFTFSMIALALLFGVLAVSSSSTAAQETTKPIGVTGGKTTLKPTKQMIRKLKRAKVRVQPTGSAKGGMRKLVFPVTGGRVGIEDGKPVGKIRHQGSGVRLGFYDQSSPYIALRNSVVDAADFTVWRFHFRSKTGDGVIPVFALSELERVEFQDGQDAIGFRAKLTLKKQSAKLLRKRLGLNVKKGTTFGIIGVLVSFAGGDGQGGGIYN